MSEILLEDFERFFADLPAAVRDDLSFMMVMLSDENIVVHDVEAVYETAAWGLFNARTRIGRIADLINAVSVFDVYFAMDARRRFAPCKARARSTSASKAANVSPILDRYADQIGDIERAKRRWRDLRRTTLSPETIASALIPSGLPAGRGRRRRAAPMNHEDNRGRVGHDAVS